MKVIQKPIKAKDNEEAGDGTTPQPAKKIDKNSIAVN